MTKLKPSEIKSMFPFEVIITQEMLDNSLHADRNNCIACQALKSVLIEELHDEIDWGTGIGRIKSVPIRSLIFDGKEKEYYDHYLQTTNTKVGEKIKFIHDKNRS